MEKGDYILASKYSDGHPQDHWCIGIFDSMTAHTPPRYNISDYSGSFFRGNGFRKVKKISAKRAAYILENKKKIEESGKSIWWWFKQKIGT